VQVQHVEIRNVRNIERADIDLGPGLTVLVGGNAQGKTSVLEALGLVARGLSFRSEDTRDAVRAGEQELGIAATLAPGATELEFGVGGGGRRFCVDGREVTAREYRGRMEVVVHWAQRLRLVRGSMRERREYLDRMLAAHRPSHARAARDYGRIVGQRNAVLATGAKGLEAWDERLIAEGARMRAGRAAFVRELNKGLSAYRGPRGERFEVELQAQSEEEAEQRAELERSLMACRARERRVGRTLVGPHRDDVALRVDGREVSRGASSGQARLLLLSLALSVLGIYRERQRAPIVGLLDDVDAELEVERARAICRDAAICGQVVVTTARSDWLEGLDVSRQVFAVRDGRVAWTEAAH
jgi:DNA replication and repair protein RecF